MVFTACMVKFEKLVNVVFVIIVSKWLSFARFSNVAVVEAKTQTRFCAEVVIRQKRINIGRSKQCIYFMYVLYGCLSLSLCDIV